MEGSMLEISNSEKGIDGERVMNHYKVSPKN